MALMKVLLFLFCFVIFMSALVTAKVDAAQIFDSIKCLEGIHEMRLLENR